MWLYRQLGQKVCKSRTPPPAGYGTILFSTWLYQQLGREAEAPGGLKTKKEKTKWQ
jgi:hypothetical protein